MFVVESAEQTGDHCYAGSADPGEQRQDLCGADADAVASSQVVEPASGKFRRRVRRCWRLLLVLATAEVFAREQDRAVDGEKRRR